MKHHFLLMVCAWSFIGERLLCIIYMRFCRKFLAYVWSRDIECPNLQLIGLYNQLGSQAEFWSPNQMLFVIIGYIIIGPVARNSLLFFFSK